ncbi:IS66 family insertion sequence element accessory protein TnpB [Aeromonas dhakensis]|uniref:IS66 family insertion sequence element accessory protein TnpB n=1 Tax=Aeromonas dhakensis TaxID=196024 RepID=UPI001A8FA91B|nr:IS66 family insertion sequence element accessory protein TnpB [Aeromonas dhakensis]
MINPPAGTRIWIVAGITDMRNGFNGLASKVQMTLKDDPLSGHVFIFRGRNGSQVRLCPNYVLHGAPQRLMQAT